MDENRVNWKMGSKCVKCFGGAGMKIGISATINKTFVFVLDF